MTGGAFLKKKNPPKERGKVKKLLEATLSIMDNIIRSRNSMRDDIGHFEKQKGTKKLNLIDVSPILPRVMQALPQNPHNHVIVLAAWIEHVKFAIMEYLFV